MTDNRPIIDGKRVGFENEYGVFSSEAAFKAFARTAKLSFDSAFRKAILHDYSHKLTFPSPGKTKTHSKRTRRSYDRD
jgi:hypothetical protein